MTDQHIFPKQLFLHDPDNGVFGDCHRTVLACLLDLPPAEVPNFGHGMPEPDEFHARIRAFLEPHGLAEFTIAYDCALTDLFASMEGMNKGRFYILGGTSKTGVNHSVLCCGGAIVHDPSRADSGIIGPMDDGYYRVTVLSVQPKVQAEHNAEAPQA